MRVIRELPGNKAQGAALILVLWLVALLTLLATTVSAISVNHRRALARYAQAAEGQEIEDSAIRLSMLAIISAPNRQRIGYESPRSMQVFDHSVAVTIERESGRIDVNVASRSLLIAAFAAGGWAESDAEQMASRVIDWRDSDDVVEPQGAEQSDYRFAAHPFSPRNAPLRTVDELRQIMGGHKIDPALLELFTVYTHAEMPDASTAPQGVMNALHWADRREMDGHRWLDTAEDAVDGLDANQVSVKGNFEVGEVIRLRACVVDSEGVPCRVVVARFTGNDRKPFQVFLWRTLTQN